MEIPSTHTIFGVSYPKGDREREREAAFSILVRGGKIARASSLATYDPEKIQRLDIREPETPGVIREGNRPHPKMESKLHGKHRREQLCCVLSRK
ncbi:hypothetical protein TNCV_2639881 [Trichonephila clavipes]|nr:hypothetical protein TNCV_2639881 [Trichonephila clavipes]